MTPAADGPGTASVRRPRHVDRGSWSPSGMSSRSVTSTDRDCRSDDVERALSRMTRLCSSRPVARRTALGLCVGAPELAGGIGSLGSEAGIPGPSHVPRVHRSQCPGIETRPARTRERSPVSSERCRPFTDYGGDGLLFMNGPTLARRIEPFAARGWRTAHAIGDRAIMAREIDRIEVRGTIPEPFLKSQ